MSEITDRARALRGVIEGLAETLDDSTAAEAMELYPMWNGKDTEYAAGARVRYGGELYKVLQAHTAQPDWSPDTAVSLFAKVLPGQDGTSIGEWVQPDSTNTNKLGARVYHNGKLWESTENVNSWEPGVFGWVEVEE